MVAFKPQTKDGCSRHNCSAVPTLMFRYRWVYALIECALNEYLFNAKIAGIRLSIFVDIMMMSIGLR